jgi:hypothetical protein
MEHKNYVEFTDDILEFFEDEKRKGDKVYLIFFCSGDCYPHCDVLGNAIDYHYNFSQEVISDIAEHYPNFYRGGWEFNRRFRKWRKMREPGVWQSITHTCSIGEIEFTEKVKDILGLVTRVWFDDEVQDENFKESFKMLKQRIFTEWYFTKDKNSSPIHLIIPRFGGGADRLDDETFKRMIFDEFKDLMDKNAVRISVVRRV